MSWLPRGPQVTNDKCSNSKAKNLTYSPPSLWRGRSAPGISPIVGRRPQPGPDCVWLLFPWTLPDARRLRAGPLSLPRPARGIPKQGKGQTPRWEADGTSPWAHPGAPRSVWSRERSWARGHTQKTPPSPRKEVFKSTFHPEGGVAPTELRPTLASSLGLAVRRPLGCGAADGHPGLSRGGEGSAGETLGSELCAATWTAFLTSDNRNRLKNKTSLFKGYIYFLLKLLFQNTLKKGKTPRAESPGTGGRCPIHTAHPRYQGREADPRAVSQLPIPSEPACPGGDEGQAVSCGRGNSTASATHTRPRPRPHRPRPGTRTAPCGLWDSLERLPVFTQS